MKRQGRAQRRSGIMVRLTARDKAVLRALGRFRIARTSDLVRYGFRDIRKDTAAARLRRLFDAGYVAVQSQGVAEENLYSLGPQGRRWLDSQGVSGPRAPRGDFMHHLAVVQTWVSTARVLQGLPNLRLLAARPDWEARAEFRGREMALVPDLLLKLQTRAAPGGNGDVILAVEVDLGTERMPVLRRKIETYATTQGSSRAFWGDAPMLVAVVLSNSGGSRRQSVEKLLETHFPGGWLSWTLEEGPEHALSLLDRRLKHPLTSSPGGEGRREPPSSVFLTESAVRGAPQFQQEHMPSARDHVTDRGSS